MIDPKIIREDPNRIRSELAKRHIDLDTDKLIKSDVQRRKLQQQFDELRSEQKSIRDSENGKRVKAELHKIEGSLLDAWANFDPIYYSLPNFSADDVPEAKDETGNELVKVVGEKRKLANPKPHYEIPSIKPLIDFERGAKVSGSRFWYLKGALVNLEFALIQYALDFYAKKGFTPMRPPSIVGRDAMLGTGFLPAEANEIYKLTSIEDQSDLMKLAMKDESKRKEAMDRLLQRWGNEPDSGKGPDLMLSGTAEVPLASYHSSEKLDSKDLPVKYIGFAPAYRREAGSYGKDTKGIIRGHEFDKLELFVFADPAKSWETHEELQAQAEEFWTSLGIPFQVVNIASGDLSAPNAKKLDIEAWMPGEEKYIEVASNSNDTDFQARRLGIKSGGEYVHTLNNTACAIGRTIAAIVENYQQDDGTVVMPDVLHQYLPFKAITKE